MGGWEEWEEEGPPSCRREAAVAAQPEREGQGSSVGREIPSGADGDLSICETPLPVQLYFSSESSRPTHLVWSETFLLPFFFNNNRERPLSKKCFSHIRNLILRGRAFQIEWWSCQMGGGGVA